MYSWIGRSWIGIALLSTLLIVGCAPMERESDMPEKKRLPLLSNGLNITKKWSVYTGEGTNGQDVKLSLVLVDSNLITADNDGIIAMINATNGKQIWRFDVDQPISAGPTIAAGKLVVGTSNGKVIAVDLNSRKIVWTSNATSEVLAAPLIADGMVFVYTMDGALTAYSLNDGRQVWRFTHNLPPLVLRRGSTPVVCDDHLIAGFSTGKVLALNKSDGTVDWSQDVAHPKGRTDLQRMVDISADLVVKNHVVYAASYQGNLAALKASNGQVVWVRDVPSYAGIVLDNNLIYVAATNGDVAALDINNGSIVWKQDALQGRGLSKPALMGANVVIADSEGFVHWLNKNTGKLVGRMQLDKDGVEATPIVQNNFVYLLGRSGKLVALVVN